MLNEYQPSAKGEPQQKATDRVWIFFVSKRLFREINSSLSAPTDVSILFVQLLRLLHLFVVLQDQLFIRCSCWTLGALFRFPATLLGGSITGPSEVDGHVNIFFCDAGIN